MGDPPLLGGLCFWGCSSPERGEIEGERLENVGESIIWGGHPQERGEREGLELLEIGGAQRDPPPFRERGRAEGTPPVLSEFSAEGL